MIPNFKTIKIGVYVNTQPINVKNTPKTKTMKLTFQIITFVADSANMTFKNARMNADATKIVQIVTINRKCMFEAKDYLQAKNPKSKIELI
jgi:hypothetical protein